MEEVNRKTMWQEVFDQISINLSLLFSKGIFLISVLFGTFLTAIGYPKEIFIFILTLVIIDIFTKQGSIVVIKYGKFTMKNYIQAWIDRHLTSREIKNGITIKVILYCPFLYISNTIGTLPQIIYGSLISNVMYTMIVFIEISSIMENFIDAGNKIFIPFRDFLNKKKKELLEDNEQDK